jgi:serine/threonine protein kinase
MGLSARRLRRPRRVGTRPRARAQRPWEKITKGHKEFEAEAVVLSRFLHPNLLALRAYYLGPKGEKLLIFDYMPKGSLSAFLHGQTSCPCSVACSVEHYLPFSENCFRNEV